MAKIIDRNWFAAGVWCLIAAACSATGIIHGFVFTPDGGYGPALITETFPGGRAVYVPGLEFGAVYLLAAVLLFAMQAWKPGKIEH